MPHSPPRDKGRYCYVKPSCTKGRDDAPKILGAFTGCNGGGTHSFKFVFQNQSVFWKLGSKDVNIYGDLGNDRSIMDGPRPSVLGGDSNEKERKPSRMDSSAGRLMQRHQLLRSMLLSFEGVETATMSHLRMRNPPNWFNLIVNSADVVIGDVDFRATVSRRTYKNLTPQAGMLVRSAPDRCSNIRAENVTITVPSGKPPV
ncbi:exopolygalacturonase [Colletotrichum graminicola]|uniref:Exopolygalacturonase n=1 Tax=Colletotrichum graminicola (strain M1.001 / M2 / FGSC 10212) TaxID=645133 RepID=E3QPP9_COLGM|nr:exopolygalacturonase [Colletotrichum graminicola M1.001]EFQ32826.1 exopolygalacturonase [Colletotrichum graminicola M1.001]WDK16468.1 exopolygalacturonase [Colletotrichum graminicola]